jgi:hypothetical protein
MVPQGGRAGRVKKGFQGSEFDLGLNFGVATA